MALRRDGKGRRGRAAMDSQRTRRARHRAALQAQAILAPDGLQPDVCAAPKSAAGAPMGTAPMWGISPRPGQMPHRSRAQCSQRPGQDGLRFSLNAARPSRASSVMAINAIWLSV